MGIWWILFYFIAACLIGLIACIVEYFRHDKRK